MWDSWCFRTKVRKDESEKVNEHLIDNFFIDFDRVLCVAIEKFELLDEIDREAIFAENIWFRNVAKRVDEANCEVSETDKQETADFSMNLYVNSSAKTRRSELFEITNCRAWCWRICSWSLLLKLNIWLQRRHVVYLFVDFDLVSNVEDEKFELFNKVIVLNAIADSNMNFWDFANEAENLCEANDVFSISHTKLTALIERWKFLTSFRASWLRICSYNFLLKLRLCLQSLQITRTHVTSWFDALFNAFDTILSVAIERFKHTDETDELITFSISTCFKTSCSINSTCFRAFCSINSTCFWASCSINSTCFWVSCSRWCVRRTNSWFNLWRSASLHEEDLRKWSLIEETSIRQMRQLLLKIVTVEFFSFSHIDLIVSIERDKSMIEDFWIRFSDDSSICFDDVASETENDEAIVDFFDASHTKLNVKLVRDEQNFEDFWTQMSWCLILSVRENENIWAKKHWFDSFFIDFDTISDALNVKCEFFDELIVSKIITDSNLCFNVAIKISNFCETEETEKAIIADFFIVSDTNLSVSTERNEFLTDFFACCSRTCSRNLFLKLKLESQRMQIIFEFLTFANETFAKSTRKISIHSLNDVDLMIVCLSNQISKAESQRQVNNSMSRSDFRYRRWHCWRCCKNFANSLNCRSSHVRVESKISISWSVDIDFSASSAFNAFDLTRLTFLTTLIFVFLIAFRFSDEMFNFCSFCETDEVNEADEAIKANSVEFSKISHAFSSRNCKTNSYACWFRATHEEYWKRCE